MPVMNPGQGLGLSVRRRAVSAAIASAKLLQTDAMFQRTMAPALTSNGFTYVTAITGAATRGNLELHQIGGDGYVPRIKPLRVQNEFGDGGANTDDHGPQEIIQLSDGRAMLNYSKHQDGQAWRYAVTDIPLNASGTAFDRLRAEFQIPLPGGFTTGGYATTCVGFSTGEVLKMARAENATNSSWFLTRATESSIVAGNPTWTTVEVVRTSVTTERGYFWMTKDPLNADTLWVYGVKSTLQSSGLYCFKIVRNAGNWVAQRYDGTTLTLPINPATDLTGRSTIAPFTDPQTYIAEHGIVGSDGRLRVLGAEAPTGWGVANSQNNLQYSYFYDDGTTWRKVVLVSGQGSLADAPTQMAGGSLKHDAPNQVLIGVGGVGVNKEIQHWTVNEGTQTASKTRDITTGSAVSNMRPWWVKNGTAALELVYVRRNSMANFDNFETDLMGFGTATPGSYTATPGSYEAETNSIIAGWTVQPTLARKNAIDRYIKGLKAGRVSGTNVWNAIVRMLIVAQDEQSFLLPWKGTGSPTKLGAPVFSGVKGYRGPVNQTDGYEDVTWATLGLSVTSMVGIFMTQSAAAGNNTSVNWTAARDSTLLVTNGSVRWNVSPPTITVSPRNSVSMSIVGDATGTRIFINDVQVATDATTAGRAIPNERLLGSGGAVNQHGFMLLPAGNDNQIVDAINESYQFFRANGAYVA